MGDSQGKPQVRCFIAPDGTAIPFPDLNFTWRHDLDVVLDGQNMPALEAVQVLLAQRLWFLSVIDGLRTQVADLQAQLTGSTG